MTGPNNKDKKSRSDFGGARFYFCPNRHFFMHFSLMENALTPNFFFVFQWLSSFPLGRSHNGSGRLKMPLRVHFNWPDFNSFCTSCDDKRRSMNPNLGHALRPLPPNQCCTAIRATARWSFAAPPLLCDSTLIWGGGGLAQSRRTVTGMCSKLMPWAASLTYLNSNVNCLSTKGKLQGTERRNKNLECCLCGIWESWTSISIVLATRMV